MLCATMRTRAFGASCVIPGKYTTICVKVAHTEEYRVSGGYNFILGEGRDGIEEER